VFIVFSLLLAFELQVDLHSWKFCCVTNCILLSVNATTSKYWFRFQL